MSLDKRTREQMLAHCDAIHEDDGVDPREFFKLRSHRDKPDRKAQQLCRQVGETIDQILAGELGDAALNALRVASVVPAPDASRMLVTLVATSDDGSFDRAAIEHKLAAVTGLLRSAVAAAITRRKAPNLSFVVIGPNDGEATTQATGGDA
ncbi:ribosome-binding factor A [Lacipirellula limnantheis]|uniref:Ribosome-binding factor A n=1 Tax=Lacipirellula limnantheis TaxID=2528024 RepID=A0A517U626_9BACT|nr:ribosome-binding factor A [Lacipirellula limnantheis]QDT76086.1 ribosome-binding factor A [Lacipirellula limnantheis]